MTFGVMISLASSGMPGKNSWLRPHWPLQRHLLLGVVGLCFTGHISRQAGLEVKWVVRWRPDPWPTTGTSSWTYYTSSVGKSSGIGNRQADTGGVWHHTTVVTASSAAGHPGFLFDVQSKTASQPRLFYLGLHLKTGRWRKTESYVCPLFIRPYISK